MSCVITEFQADSLGVLSFDTGKAAPAPPPTHSPPNSPPLVGIFFCYS